MPHLIRVAARPVTDVEQRFKEELSEGQVEVDKSILELLVDYWMHMHDVHGIAALVRAGEHTTLLGFGQLSPSYGGYRIPCSEVSTRLRSSLERTYHPVCEACKKGALSGVRS